MKGEMTAYLGMGLACLLSGCASNSVALGPVGPSCSGPNVAGADGHLVVFSATDKSIPWASDDPVVFDLHSGYDIKDAAGKQVRYVPNHLSNMDEWPDEVALPEGTYEVVARSSELGSVSVPVTIEGGKTTTVRL
jgi:hypothetical protein